MSAFLPTVQDDARSLSNKEEFLENGDEEPSDPGGPRSLSGSSEDGAAPLLDTSDTLEYSDGKRPSLDRESGPEMATFAAGQPEAAASRPEAEASEADARAAGGPDGERAAGAAELEKEGGPVGAAPPVCDPSVRVLAAERGSLRGKEPAGDDGGSGETPLENGGRPERQPFLAAHRASHGRRPPARGYAPPDAEWPDSDEEARGPKSPPCPRCTRANLKATAALAGSLIIYPCFLYGAYVFLPFDVPLMPDVNTRMLYTLRCSVFATVPILMGIIVYGLARLCSSSVDPFGQRKEEVEIHLRFVTDSIHLFVLFFVNLVVLATYIPQEVLKLLPLLTAFFALARLIYWLTFAISSTFRGFGYGLTFFPILGLLVCNLSYMFVLAPDKMFATSASVTQEEEQGASPRQRFWG